VCLSVLLLRSPLFPPDLHRKELEVDLVGISKVLHSGFSGMSWLCIASYRLALRYYMAWRFELGKTGLGMEWNEETNEHTYLADLPRDVTTRPVECIGTSNGIGLGWQGIKLHIAIAGSINHCDHSFSVLHLLDSTLLCLR